MSLNQRVVGSNPTAPTNKFNNLGHASRAVRRRKVAIEVAILTPPGVNLTSLFQRPTDGHLSAPGRGATKAQSSPQARGHSLGLALLGRSHMNVAPVT